MNVQNNTIKLLIKELGKERFAYIGYDLEKDEWWASTITHDCHCGKECSVVKEKNVHYTLEIGKGDSPEEAVRDLIKQEIK